MLALRVLVFACGALIIFALLGYSLNRDRRWLRVAGYAFKGGLALAAVIGLIMLMRRYLVL